MPRARSRTIDEFQTSAAPQEQGSGCLSGFLIPPLAVILISLLLAIFAFRQPTPTAVMAAPAESASGGLAPFFRPEVLYWSDSILRWSAATGVDPNLAAVVMQIESCGDPRARSRSGAMGLFQVMPFHFTLTDNPYDPDTNALRGLGYLARSLQAAGGNARLALAGYNGGIGVIARAEWTWPAETQRYVRFGAPIYEDALRGETQSAVLDEWYTKYGASLCQQASQN
jgi:soluble lytic murein transglycosylase-like protein